MSVYTYGVYLSLDCGISFIIKCLKQSSKELLECVIFQLCPETSCWCKDDIFFSPYLVVFFNSIHIKSFKNKLTMLSTFATYALAQKFMAVGIIVLTNSIVKMKIAIKNTMYSTLIS